MELGKANIDDGEFKRNDELEDNLDGILAKKLESDEDEYTISGEAMKYI